MSDARDLLAFLSARGHAPECTDAAGLNAEIAKGPITGYIGFDPTADSLHIGNMVQLMLLRRLQMAGHRPIALVGGGTGKVGDPSGRDETRQLLTPEKLAHNLAGIKSGLDRFLRFDDSATGAVLVDNSDWLDQLGYIDMLRMVGSHFTINRMLAMDSVKLRLEREQPLSFIEFNYMIMQGYDFVVLHEKFGTVLQMGGSDQLGNIIQGIELGRRMKGYHLFGVSQPLLTTASGQKMGKSVGGAVWINADRCSPYDFWQYWRNAEDGDVGRWLRLFTDLPLDEIRRLEALGGGEINDAKKILANEVTALVHGRAAADSAAATAKAAFEDGQAGGDIPGIALPYVAFEAGVGILDLLVRAGLAASKGEAKRLIAGGGARLNRAVVSDEQLKVTLADFANGTLELAAGKKRFVRVTVV